MLEAGDGGPSFFPWLASDLGHAPLRASVPGVAEPGRPQLLRVKARPDDRPFHSLIHLSSIFELLLCARHHCRSWRSSSANTFPSFGTQDVRNITIHLTGVTESSVSSGLSTTCVRTVLSSGGAGSSLPAEEA